MDESFCQETNGRIWWKQLGTFEFGEFEFDHVYTYIYIYKRLKWGFDFAEIQIVARNGTIRWKTSKTECDFRAKQYGNLSLIHN